jgi:catechol 2,3-dioxygenase-like lactoylglutathione lyase family enzyme
MVDMHPEVNVIAVSDVERSKKFYERLGWRLDDDVAPADGVRLVQFTPPGSAASVTFGEGVTPAAPGSAVGGLTVSEIKAAHDDLVSRGVEASEMWHGAPFPPEARIPGPDPERTSYGSFFSFADPDGNAWLVQEVTTRLPGRVGHRRPRCRTCVNSCPAVGHSMRTRSRRPRCFGWSSIGYTALTGSDPSRVTTITADG